MQFHLIYLMTSGQSRSICDVAKAQEFIDAITQASGTIRKITDDIGTVFTSADIKRMAARDSVGRR